jgi:hypothetical protein
MGFLIYHIQPFEGDLPVRVTLHRLRPLVLGGAHGLFARQLPDLARKDDDGKWSLTARELLLLDDPDAKDTSGVFFTLASPTQINLLQLIKVDGRTASLVTDALFHFKVVGKPEQDTGSTDSIVVSSWDQNTECYEQMRLEGGILGGNWAWGQPPQPVGAAVLSSAAKKRQVP